MKVITSRENAIYKSAQKLLRKKHRDRTGQYLLEGRKPLLDALASGLVIEKVFVCNGENSCVLPDELPEHRVIGLEGRLFDGLSDTEHSQGLIAVIRRPENSWKAFAERGFRRSLVILDRLQDPGNVGTIIRTAEAAGFTGVICARGTADPFGPKAVRASSGAILRMPVLTDLSAERILEHPGMREHRLAVTCMDGEVSCFELKGDRPLALVIGNEGSGVGEEFRRAAELTIRIPMAGGAESLNAAVAAGIVMYGAEHGVKG